MRLKSFLRLGASFVLFLQTQLSWSAACCGGGAAFPSLILGDDRFQIGLSSSYSSIIGDAPVSGLTVFRSSTDIEIVSSYQVDAVTLLSDQWQMGASLPFSKRSRSTSSQSSSAFGVGDASVTLGYEALPEWSYSSWKPRGFVYAQTILPTGGSIYNSNQTFAVDARGRGFYTLHLGFFLIKSWGPWDTSLRASVSHSFSRTFIQTGGDPLRVEPSIGGLAAWGIGLSPYSGDWRLGLSLSPVIEGASNVAATQKVVNTSLELSRTITTKWALSLSYLDQTLLGPAQNVSLSRGLAISAKYREER